MSIWCITCDCRQSEILNNMLPKRGFDDTEVPCPWEEFKSGVEDDVCNSCKSHLRLVKREPVVVEPAAIPEAPVIEHRITDFLDTKTSREELAIALKVLREFKSNENAEEWMFVSFKAWEKLEQLEEYLAFLVEGKPLAADTIAYMKKD